MDSDAAAWLGLIQHYGGPTRLLDVTRSPFIALFFAFEPGGNDRGNDSHRCVWALDEAWCSSQSQRIMAEQEGIDVEMASHRLLQAQNDTVAALTLNALASGRPLQSHQLFRSFRPFRGVFPLEPWKPDARQIAQQARFLVAADVDASFMENLGVFASRQDTFIQFQIPEGFRPEILHQLSHMNITYSSLFPDLGGLARSLRVFPNSAALGHSACPWESSSVVLRPRPDVSGT